MTDMIFVRISGDPDIWAVRRSEIPGEAWYREVAIPANCIACVRVASGYRPVMWRDCATVYVRGHFEEMCVCADGNLDGYTEYTTHISGGEPVMFVGI